MRILNFVRGGVGCLAAAVLLTAAPAAHAQSEVFYYAGMTQQENADVRAWSVLYWQRVDQGGGNPGAGFSFDTPIMNSQLFNPLRSARITLDSISTGSTNYCDHMNSLPGVGELDSQTLEQRAVIKDLMLFGEIATYQGTPEEWIHELLIAAAPPDYPYLVFDENGVLISVDLPLAEVSGVAADAALALNVSPQTEQIIATLIGAGGLWRSQCTDVPMWKALITNEVSTVEQFKDKVDHFLWLEDVPSGLSRIIYANFGVFGELPVLLIRLEDCFLLMDPTNSNLSGPFALTSPVDATALLSMHSDAYHAGYSIRYFTSKGTPFIAASELPNAPCEAAPATPCNATTVNTVACGSNGNERCSCRLNGTSYEWTCTTCPPGKSCQVIAIPGGGTGLKCQ